MKGERNEAMRQLMEVALSHAKALTSKQTRFLHTCYDKPDEEPHLAIPVVDNFLYVLALFRSRKVDQVTEGRDLLEKLLFFQNQIAGSEEEGNFPVYLHQYPHCKDRTTAIHVTFIILLLLKQFSTVISEMLSKALQRTGKLALEYAWRWIGNKSAPIPVSMKLAAASIGIKEILDCDHFYLRGEQLLRTVLSSSPAELYYSPSQLGGALCALALVDQKALSACAALRAFAMDAWHSELCCYGGPAFREWQSEFEPQTTLYDLLMCCSEGQLSARVLKRSSAHLEAALLLPMEQELPTAAYPKTMRGVVEGQTWQLFQMPTFGYSFFNSCEVPLNPIWEKGFHPFRMFWGKSEKVHSFVCQKGSCYPKIQAHHAHHIDLIFELGLPEVNDEKEKNREILFCFDASADYEFLVSQKRSSTFHLEEVISIRTEEMHFTMQFFLEEGEGKFLGHRMLGNRPSQIEAKGARRYQACDWMLFLRTVHRSHTCRIRVALHILRMN